MLEILLGLVFLYCAIVCLQLIPALSGTKKAGTHCSGSLVAVAVAAFLGLLAYIFGGALTAAAAAAAARAAGKKAPAEKPPTVAPTPGPTIPTPDPTPVPEPGLPTPGAISFQQRFLESANNLGYYA